MGWRANVWLFLSTGVLAVTASHAATPNELSAREKAEGWVLLFDGRSLDGWRASEAPSTFSVKNGEIVVHGPRSHLYYDGPVHGHDFKNFELELEVMTLPKANSGVYFHTTFQEAGWPAQGYEVQVNNTQSDKKRTAGLYNVQDNYDAVAKDNVWFRLSVKVQGKHIETFVDGKRIVDFTEPEDWKPPADNEGRRISHGTVALQGHDPGSEVHYRTIKIKVLN
jgi:hypothetical protein